MVYWTIAVLYTINQNGMVRSATWYATTQFEIEPSIADLQAAYYSFFRTDLPPVSFQSTISPTELPPPTGDSYKTEDGLIWPADTANALA